MSFEGLGRESSKKRMMWPEEKEKCTHSSWCPRRGSEESLGRVGRTPKSVVLLGFEERRRT